MNAAADESRLREPLAIVVGPFPPPVHGASVVTQRVAELFDEVGRTGCVDTAVSRDGPAAIYHLRRIVVHVSAAGFVVRRARSRNGCVYLSVPGGASTYQMLIVAAAARARRSRIALHHHSFSYLNDTSLAHRLLFRLAGQRAVHIALCEEMKRQLQEQYAAVDVRVWSNRHPMDLAPVPLRALPASHEPIALGHMANLTVEKGLDVVLETLQLGLDSGLDLTLHLAGKPADPTSEAMVARASLRFGDRLHLWGFVVEAEKVRFLETIDAFIFPSSYRNEAEPVVALEALARGVPCFVTAVGCLGSMPGAYSIGSSDTFATRIVKCLSGRLAIESVRDESGDPVLRDPSDFLAALTAGRHHRSRNRWSRQS